MPKFARKPLVVDAIFFEDRSEAITAISELTNQTIRVNYQNPGVPTLIIERGDDGAELVANVGDWVVRGPDGRLTVWVPELFKECFDQLPQPTIADPS